MGYAICAHTREVPFSPSQMGQLAEEPERKHQLLTLRLGTTGRYSQCCHKRVKTHQWVTQSHWVTRFFIMMNKEPLWSTITSTILKTVHKTAWPHRSSVRAELGNSLQLWLWREMMRDIDQQNTELSNGTVLFISCFQPAVINAPSPMCLWQFHNLIYLNTNQTISDQRWLYATLQKC